MKNTRRMEWHHKILKLLRCKRRRISMKKKHETFIFLKRIIVTDFIIISRLLQQTVYACETHLTEDKTGCW